MIFMPEILPDTRHRSSAAQRIQLSPFGPREGRESKRIRRWAEGA
jgi:hypothetical protein